MGIYKNIKDGKIRVKVLKFNFDDLKLKKISKRMSALTKRKIYEKNMINYINFIKEILEKNIKKEEEKKSIIDNIFWSKNNSDKLLEYLDPMTFLGYSPIDSEELKDDEIGIRDI